jgi:hypothetical protein
VAGPRSRLATCKPDDAIAADPHAAPFLLDVIYADEAPRGAEELAAVSWPWKLIVAREAGALRPVAFFDLSADPGERHDLLADPAAAPGAAQRVAGLKGYLEQRLAAGPLAGGAQAEAGAMDPAMQRWLREVGYLR